MTGILILGELDDPHINEVLRRRPDIEAFVIAPREFIREGFTLEQHGTCAWLWMGSAAAPLELTSASTVWIRRPDMSVSSDHTRHAHWEQDYLEEEWKALLRAILLAAPDSRCVNPLTNAANAGNRPYQLISAQRAGFRVPRWVVTNRTDRLPDGNLVVKRLATSRLRVPDGIRLYTGAVEMGDFQSADFQNGASLLQLRIALIEEVRVTVIGSQVFAHRLIRDHPEHSDYREGQDDSQWEICDLPTQIETAASALVSSLGLVYAAIDLGWDGNDYEFFEINPSGEYAWLDEISRGALSDAMADLLFSSPR